MVKVIVKTPTRTWTPKQGVLYGDIIEKQIEKNASAIALKNVAELSKTGLNYASVIDQRISIFATFFQRVVSRTPLDEKYTWYELNEKTVRMNKRTHIPDKGVHSQCRYDWYITDGETTVSAKDFPQKYFDVVNDKSAIEGIKKKFKSKFAPRLSKKNAGTALETLEGLYIKNDNPHYAVLEYGGGFRWPMNGTIKQGAKYKHGVENGHSVQAPVGMYRITEMELLRESNRNVKTNLAKRYKGNGLSNRSKIEKTPSDKDLEDFWKLMKKKKIRYSDIKRYLGV